MNSILFFPPGWTPFSPYLALPVLKGALEGKNIHIDIVDMNIEFYDYVLDKQCLSAAYEICIEKFNVLQNEELQNKELYLKYSKAILLNKVIEKMDYAKQIIRTDEFYNDKKRSEAINILSNALYLINAAYEEININFHKISFKYSDQSTSEILDCLSNIQQNPLNNYYERWINKIISSNIDFIGISITGNDQLIPALLLANLIKKRCLSVKHITLGGNYITRLATDWTSPHPFFNFVDSIIVYEGEDALSSLIKALEDGHDFSLIPNLCYIKDNKLIKNEVKGVRCEELALPNFDGFPLESYFSPQVILPMYTSRSCFNKCAFCTIPYGTSGVYRKLDIRTVYNRMESLWKKYGTSFFTFVDETFEVKRMEELASEIINTNKEFYWYCETRFTPALTEETCKTLYKGGCRNIQFGLESYNQNILDKMKKNVKIQWIESNLVNCMKNNISVHLFFMVGFPTETKLEAMRTFKFTDEMIHKSQNLYNNQFSTRGFGTFGLNKHSYVWQHPEEYKIKIIENPEEDLNIGYDYEAYEGLTAKEAGELVAMHSKGVNINLENYGYKNFFEHQTLILSEEQNFLNKINNATIEENKSYKIRYKLKDFPLNSTLLLNSSSKYLCLEYEILTSDFLKNKNLLIYNVEHNTVYQLDSDFEPVLKRLMNTGIPINELLCEFEVHIIKQLEDLLYYNHLNINYEQKTRKHIIDSKLKFNSDIIVLEEKGNDIIRLFNKNNGNTVRVNNFSYKILKVFDSPMVYSELLSELSNRGMFKDNRPIINLINIAIESSILYVI